MARPNKEGLDYFPLDVDIDQDDKIALIEATHGLEGFSIVIKLFLKIYNNSYFYEWGEKEQLLFSKRVNVDINKVNDVINDCLKWEIFSKSIYETHEILTSSGIQRRYLEATTRRKQVKIPKELLLLDNETVNAYNNLIIVDVNGINEELTTQRKQKQKVNRKKTENEEVNRIVQFWDNNGFGFNNMQGKHSLLLWLDDSSFKNPSEMILEAMNIACSGNKRTLRYVEGILRNWQNENILTIEEVKNQNDKKNKKLVDKKDKYEDMYNDMDF